MYSINHGSPSDLFLDGLGVGLREEGEEGAGEIVGVAVGVAQLVGDRIQEQVPPYRQPVNFAS